MNRPCERPAYFCGACWKESTVAQVMLCGELCPHCGADARFVRRTVPAAPRALTIGLEPIGELYREAWLRARIWWWRRRVYTLHAGDPALPRAAVRLALLKAELHRYTAPCAGGGAGENSLPN